MIDGRLTWEDFEPHVVPNLGDEDDVALWRACVADVYRDAAYLCQHNPKERWVETVLGSCSHWLRPHQTRWTADGGFAWPTGYAGAPFSRSGLPEHDWHVRMFFDFEQGSWTAVDPRKRFAPRSLLTFRVSVPSRTTRHPQAAVHTIWIPGSPPCPKEQLVQFYGYRRGERGWELRATSDTPAPYGVVAELATEERSR